MISFDGAIGLVDGLAKPLGTECVPLDQADGRVLAAPVIADHDFPACAVSAMDGYAVREADLAALPVTLPVTMKSFAGSAMPNLMAPSTCVRVFTGAAMPPGADRVVVQEDVIAEEAQAHFHLPLGKARHIRAAAADFAKGDVLVSAGKPLNPQRLVAAAAANRAEVMVIRQPRVAILAHGDELKPPGFAGTAPGQIPDSLSIALAALIRRWHGVTTGIGLVPDDLSQLRRAASQMVAEADVVVVTGGASVGEKDFAKAMFEGTDLRLVFSKVAIRPGKPVWLGKIGNTLILGLPGNPTSALVTARLFLAPLLAGLAGFDPGLAWAWSTRPCLTTLGANGDRHGFLRAKSNGEAVEPLSDPDSGAQKALASAEYLIRRTPHAPSSPAGMLVDVLPL